MTMNLTPSSQSKLAVAFVIVCFGALLYFLYLVFRPFISVLIWAAVLTVVSPLTSWIFKRLRGRRTITSFVTCALLLILIVLPMVFIGYLVTQQSIALYQGIRRYRNHRTGERAAGGVSEAPGGATHPGYRPAMAA